MERKYEKIKIIVSEVDGIVTEGMDSIDTAGFKVMKSFYMKDFEAINEIKKHFKFIFLSRDPYVSVNLCRQKNIPFFYDKDKIKALRIIMTKYGVTPDEVVYIGCTYSDIKCVEMVPISLCPADAVLPIKVRSQVFEDIYGGTGVICGLLDTILSPEILARQREMSLTNSN